MAASRTLTVQFAGSDKGLKRGLQDALNGLDDIEDAGERAAAAIKIFADQTESNMREAAAATDALKQALGDEVVAEIERAGGSVDAWVNDLRKLGLTYEDVAASADKLATQIKNAERVNASSLRPMAASADTAATSVRRLGTEADQSRSVLANLVGNSLQDLGQLGGIAGSAGVALGQLGEYAADGNIKIGNLVKMAGPLAGLGLATWGISAAMDAAAKRAEEAARKTEVLRDILEKLNSGDTAGAAEGLVTEYEKTIEILERYGYTAADVQSTIEGQGYLFRRLTDDLAELTAMRDELLTKQAATPLGQDDAEQLDWLISQITDLQAVMGTLGTDQEKYAQQSKWLEDFKRRVDEVNASVAAGSGYWGDVARAAQQAASVSNDLADQDKAATSAANKMRALREEVENYIATTKNIPDEEITEIRAAMDAGNIALVERLLATLTRPRLVNIGVALSGLGGGRSAGKGPSGTVGAKSSDPTVAYSASSLLSSMMADAKAATGGGGGGGGGGADTDPMAEMDSAMSVLYDTGQITLAAYRKYLSDRLGAYATYSKEYKTIWDGLRALDAEEKKAQDDAAAAAKQRAEDEKKAADEAKKAREDQLAKLQQLLDLLTGFMSVQYGNLEGTGRNVTGSGAFSSTDAQQLIWMLADQFRIVQEGNQ